MVARALTTLAERLGVDAARGERLRQRTGTREEMAEKSDRVGEVEDIMGAVVYLASDASALVTGSSMLIDGGWTAD